MSSNSESEDEISSCTNIPVPFSASTVSRPCGACATTSSTENVAIGFQVREGTKQAEVGQVGAAFHLYYPEGMETIQAPQREKYTREF